MKTEEQKRSYTAPEIVDFGQMEELTKGSGLGGVDFFWFGEAQSGCRYNCTRS